MVNTWIHTKYTLINYIAQKILVKQRTEFIRQPTTFPFLQDLREMKPSELELVKMLACAMFCP